MKQKLKRKWQPLWKKFNLLVILFPEKYSMNVFRRNLSKFEKLRKFWPFLLKTLLFQYLIKNFQIFCGSYPWPKGSISTKFHWIWNTWKFMPRCILIFSYFNQKILLDQNLFLSKILNNFFLSEEKWRFYLKYILWINKINKK